MENNAPNSALAKKLRSQHPLYQKLSGDVVWLVYEEHGYDADACGKAMDDFIATMHSTLAAMHRLENGEARHFMVLGEPYGAQCVGRAGQIFTTETSQWREFLPPYAVGCSLRCQTLTPAELLKIQVSQRQEGCACHDATCGQHIRPPACGVYCPYLA